MLSEDILLHGNHRDYQVNLTDLLIDIYNSFSELNFEENKAVVTVNWQQHHYVTYSYTLDKEKYSFLHDEHPTWWSQSLSAT